MSYRAWLLTVLALSVGLATTITLEAEAQRGFGGMGRPVRIEGYWDGKRSDADVIGTLVVSPDGTHKRTFGVTAAQSSQPPEEGMQIFQASSLQPIALILRGRQDMVTRFMEAKPTERIIALGLYMGGTANLVLSSVEVQAPPAPAPPD